MKLIFDELARNERMHYFEKKPQKLHKGQHFFGFQLARGAPALEAGGKPSTRFPPLKNVIFFKFHQNFDLTFDMSSVEQIDKCLHFQAGFSMNFDREILTAFLVMNEHITSKKKPQKLHKCQHFFGF